MCSRRRVSTVAVVTSFARYAYQFIVALWLGGAVFFAAAVAPALFKVLTSSQAAAVVGKLLPILERSAMAVPALLVAAAWVVEGAPTGGHARVRLVVLGVMLLVAAVGVFVVTPQIAALRAQAGGDISSLAPGDPLRRSFGRMHGVSTLLLLTNLVLAAVALGLPPRAR